jgi:hypothetical protein
MRYFENEDNNSLLRLYKNIMVSNFHAQRSFMGTWHPTYEHNCINLDDVPKYFPFRLYNSTSEKILEEINLRMCEGSFYQMAWWTSRGILSTKISYPALWRQHKENNKSSIKTVDEKLETITYKDKIHTLLGSGTKRKAYLSPCKTYVIKIPKEPVTLGILENKTEAKTYANNPNSIYAKCELIENDWLKMEYVEPGFFTKNSNLPDWTLSIAEHQVGYTLDGRLVAYDYGSEK